MTHTYRNQASEVLSDYSHLRTLPAMLSVAFVLASLYQFGGISEVHLSWLDYTLSTQHSVVVSLGAYVVAFMSSETKQFENYDTWERALIAVAPIVILGYEFTQVVTDLLVQLGDPLGYQIAFMITVVSWAVAVR